MTDLRLVLASSTNNGFISHNLFLYQVDILQSADRRFLAFRSEMRTEGGKR